MGHSIWILTFQEINEDENYKAKPFDQLQIFFVKFVILKMMILMNIQIFIDKQKKYYLPQEVIMI